MKEKFKHMVDRTLVYYVIIGILNFIVCTAIMFLLFNICGFSDHVAALFNYGLGSAIFTKDRKRGLALAEKVDAGMVSINSFLAFAGIAALPFGGSGESGFGRIHGADGLREFSRPRSITVEKFAAPLNLMTMTRKPRDIKIVKWMLTNVQGKM